MPNRIIYDIETTGLSRTDSSPIEFAFLEVSEQFLPIRQGCMYIKPYKDEWTIGAENVHHISKKLLDEYGVEPEYAAANIFALLNYNPCITYNGKNFDTPLLKHFCGQVGTPIFSDNDHFDLRWELPKAMDLHSMKLGEALEWSGTPVKLVEAMTQSLFGKNDIYQPHDARYDVVATYYVYRKLMKELRARV